MPEIRNINDAHDVLSAIETLCPFCDIKNKTECIDNKCPILSIMEKAIITEVNMQV